MMILVTNEEDEPPLSSRRDSDKNIKKKVKTIEKETKESVDKIENNTLLVASPEETIEHIVEEGDNTKTIEKKGCEEKHKFYQQESATIDYPSDNEEEVNKENSFKVIEAVTWYNKDTINYVTQSQIDAWFDGKNEFRNDDPLDRPIAGGDGSKAWWFKFRYKSMKYISN
jgi:hypothetical protein